jgi:hypothetical protein
VKEFDEELDKRVEIDGRQSSRGTSMRVMRGLQETPRGWELQEVFFTRVT